MSTVHPSPGPSAGPGTFPGDDPRRRGRVGLSLGALVILALAVVLVATAVLAGHHAAPPPPAPVNPPAPDTGWDVAAETALAAAAMLALPESAALPHALSADSAGPPITLPKPTQTAGRWAPGGFAPTPEGALAQLAALTVAGLAGADPQTYAGAYRSIALPGAPDPQRARLTTDLQRFRARAGLPETGAVAQLSVDYRPVEGQIKGTTDDGRYVVACVLGELTIGADGQSVSGGAGDCQALRYVGGNWGISPGAPAAPAPLAWPGSAEAAAAGYRELR